MLDALPWVLCTGAVLAVLVMVCLDGARRRRAGDGGAAGRKLADAATTRRAVQAATRANLERLNAGLEGEDPEGAMADAANRAKEDR